jgi:hypothetical protein
MGLLQKLSVCGLYDFPQEKKAVQKLSLRAFWNSRSYLIIIPLPVYARGFL